MPRKGYVLVTVTEDAHAALMELKTKLNAKSASEAIIKLNTLIDTFYTILSPDYAEWIKEHTRQERKAIPIRIQIRQ